MKGLIEQRQIQVVGSVSSAVLGYRSFALVTIKANAVTSRQVAGRIAEIPNADLVVCVAGQYDIVPQLACRNDDELLSNLDDMRTMDGMTIAEVFPYLRGKVLCRI
ncbi:hypothetical protein [Streptomyces phaeochromogenes]